MKRADIVLNEPYACKVPGRIAVLRCVVREIRQYHVLVSFQRPRHFGIGTIEANAEVRTAQVLMPWEAWEAEQKAKQEQRAAIDAQRMAAHESLGQRLHKRLVDRAVVYEAWDPQRRTVTLRWEDLARLLVLP